MKSELILSLQAYSFRHLTFVETLAVARRLGFRCLESYPGQRLGGGFAGTTDYKTISPETLAKLKEYLATSPVKVVSYGVTGARNADEWRRLMEFCRTLDIKQVQIEAGASKEQYDMAEMFAARYSVRVSLHNHRQELGKPEPMFEALRERGPMLGAGADVGHWVRAGVNPLDGVKLLKGKFHTVHLVDIAREAYGFRDLPLGSGVIDVKGILKELGEQGGTIYVTIEYETPGAGLEGEVAACVRWYRAWERGEIGDDNQLRTATLTALWCGAKTDRPANWDAFARGNEGVELGRKTAKMTQLAADPATAKANRPGANPREEPPMAIGTNPKTKYCQVNWQKGAWLSCALKAPDTATVYTLSSSELIFERTPTAWKLYGSKDGKEWFLLDERKNQLFLANFLLKGYQIQHPQPCSHFKIEILANGGDEHLQFSRLAFFK